MNPRDFILEVYDGKIHTGDAIGIVKIDTEKPDDALDVVRIKPSFKAGRLGYINFVPRKVDFGQSKTDYFNIDLVQSAVYYPCKKEYIEPGNVRRTVLPESPLSTERIYKDEKMNTLHSSREDFERVMNSLMEPIKTKKRLPIFVRNLSKIPGWQSQCR